MTGTQGHGVTGFCDWSVSDLHDDFRIILTFPQIYLIDTSQWDNIFQHYQGSNKIHINSFEAPRY